MIAGCPDSGIAVMCRPGVQAWRARSGGAAVHSECIQIAERGAQQEYQSDAFGELEGHDACRRGHAEQIGDGGRAQRA